MNTPACKHGSILAEALRQARWPGHLTLQFYEHTGELSVSAAAGCRLW